MSNYLILSASTYFFPFWIGNINNPPLSLSVALLCSLASAYAPRRARALVGLPDAAAAGDGVVGAGEGGGRYKGSRREPGGGEAAGALHRRRGR